MSAVLAHVEDPAPRILDAAFLADPYPAYRALREAGPIHYSEEFFGGAWLLTRHADVEAALRDARLSARRTGGWVMRDDASRAELKDFQGLFARAMLFLDAPDHGRIRRVLNAGFRPEVLQRLAPMIAARVEARLDALEGAEQADWMEAVARPLPAEVIAAMMGVAPDAQPAFVCWSDDLAAFIGAPVPTLPLARRAQASLLAMSRWFEQLLPQRRARPGDDLVSRLVAAEARGEIEGGAELLAQCAMLLFAGHETTRNLLGNGLHALLSVPGAWARFVAEPDLRGTAVRELLRWESPVQYTGRRVATRMVLHGRTLERGELVVALIGAANRDPARHPDPDRLDLARAPGPMLSFGSGPHVCIGAMLTLLEADIVFGALARRCPHLSLAEPVPAWNGNPVYRGLERLPVCIGRGR